MMNKTVAEIEKMGFVFDGRIDDMGFDDEQGEYEVWVAYWGETALVKDGIVVEECE